MSASPMHGDVSEGAKAPNAARFDGQFLTCVSAYEHQQIRRRLAPNSRRYLIHEHGEDRQLLRGEVRRQPVDECWYECL
jgi:hypothetical protein